MRIRSHRNITKPAVALAIVTVLASGCAAAPAAGPSTDPDGVTDSTAPGVVSPVPGLNAASPTSIAPVTQAPGPGSNGFIPGFPGDVAPGAVRWGAAIGGNSDPARHEAAAGTNLDLRRTYFSWSQRTGSLVKTARTDLAAGRLPWVSVKPPSWADMARGAYDGQIDEMLRALDGLPGPVWLTVHHEPEGGGGSNTADDPAGPAAWRAMQQRIRMRLDALRVDNVAFAPILMAWTFNPLSKRDPADWWVDGVWDFAGINHYMSKESAPTVWSTTWTRVNSFYAAKGLKVALGEWGNVGVDAVAAAEMTDFYQRALASGSTPGVAQVIGMSYFDSNLNSPKTGGWELKGQPLDRFRQIMTLAPSVSVNEVG